MVYFQKVLGVYLPSLEEKEFSLPLTVWGKKNGGNIKIMLKQVNSSEFLTLIL